MFQLSFSFLVSLIFFMVTALDKIENTHLQLEEMKYIYILVKNWKHKVGETWAGLQTDKGVEVDSRWWL